MESEASWVLRLSQAARDEQVERMSTQISQLHARIIELERQVIVIITWVQWFRSMISNIRCVFSRDVGFPGASEPDDPEHQLWA